ncbi:uncharacterized protein LOC143473857 [Brachyhypopomus gauderio]|uniref:uncharacterized protein LOC143473857 n=1 Tax=Brachyhypopomus gauderio TaxID=698409 RepID=UPI0040424D86
MFLSECLELRVLFLYNTHAHTATLMNAQTSRMLHFFIGIVFLLLDVLLIYGQTVEASFLEGEELIPINNDSLTLTGNTTPYKDLTENNKAEFHTNLFFSPDEKILEETYQNVTYEDEETFQDEELHLHYRSCDGVTLVKFLKVCWSVFNMSMVKLGEDEWCNWKEVLSHYNILTMCMEYCSELARCFYPNHMVEEMFVNVHEQYFSSCVPTEEELLREAPPSVLLTLTLLPMSIIPVLVYLVIWRSNVMH